MTKVGTAPCPADRFPMQARLETWTELSLSKGALTLTLLPGVGGRLWAVALDGAQLLFQNPDLSGKATDLARLDRLPTRSPQFGFPLWGGEKTWIAPEASWPGGAPYPALDSGPYRVSGQTSASVQMTSQVCPQSGLEVMREITLLSDASWRIVHRVRNRGATRRRAGIWSVMMLNQPARIGVPSGQSEIRPVFGRDDGMVALTKGGSVSSCDAPREFKVAMPNPRGRVLVRSTHSDTWILCQTTPPQPGDEFAHGLPFEVFNSGDYPYCEAEWHAPCQDLAPGSETRFEQVFHIWRGDTPPADVHPGGDEREVMECMSS